MYLYKYIYTSFGQPKNKTTIWGWFIPPMSKGDFGDGWWDCVLPDYMSYVVRRFPKSPPNHPFFHRISINKNHPALGVPPWLRNQGTIIPRQLICCLGMADVAMDLEDLGHFRPGGIAEHNQQHLWHFLWNIKRKHMGNRMENEWFSHENKYNQFEWWFNHV